MRTPIDITDQRFGRLVALKRSVNEPKCKKGKLITVWVCLCECGNKKEVRTALLRNGQAKSCGCIISPNLAGKRFGRLTVVSLVQDASKSAIGRRIWNCLCDCGNPKTVDTASLNNGKIKSCGCFQKESRATVLITHNMTHHPLYSTWNGMRGRCSNRDNPNWEDYGGRGIKVCDRWLDIANFIEDMGKRPENHSLDRIDNDGDYTPENCRWATRDEQLNNRRNTRYLTHDGQTLTASQWARLLGIHPRTIFSRLKRGLPVEQCLNTSYTRKKR